MLLSKSCEKRGSLFLQPFYVTLYRMIGVFDSGLGGLTVLKSLAQVFPRESFYYLGDTARLPYGTKSPKTIRNYSEQILNFLSKKIHPKALVVACNSASTQISENQWLGTPLFNVIDPGVESALKTTRNGRIGLLGTRATILSGEYERRLLKAAEKEGQEVVPFSLAAPLLVPLAEEGWIEDPITNLVAYRYVHPLKAQGVDTIILGCTHYPILIEAIAKVAGPDIEMVQSGSALVTLMKKSKVNFEVGEKGPGKIIVALTDSSPHTQNLARRLLSPLEIGQFDFVDL